MGSPPDFFTRHNLHPSSRSLCLAFTKSQYPNSSIREASPQGFCSFTLSLDHHSIIQFRPPTHQISLPLASAAYKIHGPLAPLTTPLGTITLPTLTPNNHNNQPSSPLHIYHMSLLPGTPLSSLQPLARPHRRSLISSYAHLLGQTWTSPSPQPQPQTSLIASTLRPRLLALQANLPSRFHPTISRVLSSFPSILALPWVLTHGDFIASNLLISSTPTPAISGLLDWAEAEYLPFGICLYGLEELLGESRAGIDREGQKYPAPGSVFVYYEDAEELRGWFWEELLRLVPEVGKFKEMVEMAGALGLLLWHGFAWDGGRLDRVVNEDRDEEEVQRLDVMLLRRVLN
ncbi:hypothetical protein QBC34DRAFT_481047 [Podospora aff. communis PSN243]|uniref:Aminoglycoside phosphotransferase domain-containing protein n=1 Tax=Podospora aff. communis PSN243 TaxID=3040156 RepID=A0AAV9H5T5_9PEZI|nr:hypothetical protein QBC34DRAFT_481047 [Podospora aff. communis PSN243]